jgi:hypothetical protein
MDICTLAIVIWMTLFSGLRISYNDAKPYGFLVTAEDEPKPENPCGSRVFRHRNLDFTTFFTTNDPGKP